MRITVLKKFLPKVERKKNLKIKNRRSNFLKANPWQILNTPKKFFVKGAGRQKFSQKIFSPLTKNFGVLFCQQGLLLKTSGHFFKCPNLLRHLKNVFSPASKKPALPVSCKAGGFLIQWLQRLVRQHLPRTKSEVAARKLNAISVPAFYRRMPIKSRHGV